MDDKWMDRCYMDGCEIITWMDRCQLDYWMDRLMDEWINTQIDSCSSCVDANNVCGGHIQ